MMVKPSVNELLKIKGIDNRYTLVVMAAKEQDRLLQEINL